MAQKNVYTDSPFGPVEFPHFNKPDDKFNKENPPYHGVLVLEGAPALAEKERIDARVDEAFEAFFLTDAGKKAKKKDWGKYYPYEEVEDANGNPTGVIKFDLKQNSVIRNSTDGTVKHIEIGLYDADGGEMDPKKDYVNNGDIIRARWSARPITLKTNMKVGVRLDFSMIQVKEKAPRKASGFGAVEGGSYKAGQQGSQPDGGDDEASAPFDSSADY